MSHLEIDQSLQCELERRCREATVTRFMPRGEAFARFNWCERRRCLVIEELGGEREGWSITRNLLDDEGNARPANRGDIQWAVDRVKSRGGTRRFLEEMAKEREAWERYQKSQAESVGQAAQDMEDDSRQYLRRQDRSRLTSDWEHCEHECLRVMCPDCRDGNRVGVYSAGGDGATVTKREGYTLVDRRRVG